MSKIVPILAGIFILLAVSCQMDSGIESGDVTLSFELNGLTSRTAMPTGLDLRPDYVSIQGTGPGGASLTNYFVVEPGENNAVQTFELGNLVSGTWSFELTAYEWIDDVPAYNNKNKPINGKPIGEGRAGCTVRSGLVTPVEVVLLPYDGQNDNVPALNELKLILDWSFEPSQLRAELQNLRIVTEISGPGGIFSMGDATANELNAGFVGRTVDVNEPGSYAIKAELWNGDTRLTRRFEIAYVTSNVLTTSHLKMYLNGGKSEFAVQDAIPNPINLKAMAVSYDISSGEFTVLPDIADDANLNLGTDSVVMLFGWSPEGPIDFTDWYKPLNHSDTGLSSSVAGLSYVFDAYEAELAGYGVDPAELEAALADAGINLSSLLATYAGIDDMYYGTIFYTTEDLTVFEINSYPAYTPGTWPFSFEVWTLDPWAGLLWAMTDVNAVVVK